MKKLDLAELVQKLNKEAISVDEHTLVEFDAAIKAMAQWRLQVEKIRKAGGGKLPDRGLLMIGSGIYNSLEIGTKQAVVHDIEEIRIRRKG